MQCVHDSEKCSHALQFYGDVMYDVACLSQKKMKRHLL